jgi:TPR repeat protein
MRYSDGKHNSLFYQLFSRQLSGILMCFVVAFSHLAAASDEKSKAPPIDWSKPVVSRGFGESLDEGQARPDLEQEFKAGQVAYYFANYKDAYQRWIVIARQGYAAAQANIGWMYQAGLGVKTDLDQARQWYQRAAQHGHAVAQNNLGVLYEKGYGVDKDLHRAFELYRQSAQQGYRFAQYNLGKLLQEGWGTEQNLQEAITWFTKASEQGVDMATQELEKLASKTQTSQHKEMP